MAYCKRFIRFNALRCSSRFKRYECVILVWPIQRRAKPSLIHQDNCKTRGTESTDKQNTEPPQSMDAKINKESTPTEYQH